MKNPLSTYRAWRMRWLRPALVPIPVAWSAPVFDPTLRRAADVVAELRTREQREGQPWTCR